MIDPDRPQNQRSELPDPEETAGGISQKKFLGIPVWAGAVGLAVLCVVMYLFLLVLG